MFISIPLIKTGNNFFSLLEFISFAKNYTKQNIDEKIIPYFTIFINL